MWRNYLTVGLRALAKNKVYAFINIFGLSVGIAACLLILGYVRYEYSFDSWLPAADRAYQLQTDFLKSSGSAPPILSQTTAFVAGEAVKKDFPQFDRVVYATGQSAVFMQDGQPTVTNSALLTDGPLFDVLQVPFVRGDRAHALDDPHALVMSETEARNRYGNIDPIGKTLTVVSGSLKADYRVTGVYKDIPKNSTLDGITIVFRIDPADYFRGTPGVFKSWRWQNGQIYLRLKPGFDIDDIQSQMPAWEKRNIPDDEGEGPRSNPGEDEDFRFVNIRDIHIGTSRGPAVTTPAAMVLTFAVVAALILAMACMNFTNLATARASQRAREVALRKVLGATRRQLITQFVGESILVASIATLVALALAELSLWPLNTLLRAQIDFSYFGSDGILLPVLLLAIVVGLAGGLYPAFYLSGFQPAKILKANKSAANADGNGRLRNLLVVTQFAVSIGLIVCTAVVYGQTVFARSMDPGFAKDGLLQINDAGRPQVEAVSRTMLERIRRLPGVVDAGQVNIGIATGNNSAMDVFRVGSQVPVQLGIYGMDDHAIDTLGLRLLAGRRFSQSIAADNATLPSPTDLDYERSLAARGFNMIISESAVQKLGFKDPASAIGQQFRGGFVSAELGMPNATIVGVVSDVRYRTARDPIQPTIYFYQTDSFSRILVRINGDPAATNQKIEAIWKSMVPEIPYTARFATDIIHDLYDRDEVRAQLFAIFAGIAVVIGCLGLFGLAAFTADQRTKEIGIRKVLGARTRDIARLLVWQFCRPVLIANLIAWPLAWWTMRSWLNQFDQRVALDLWPFLIAGCIALAIAVATIGGHAWKIARTNPIRALRYE